MKKILLFMVALIVLFAFAACGGETVDDEKSEEQIRIDENNGVILPKLDELESVVAEIEKAAVDNPLGETYKTEIAQLRDEFNEVTKNHQKIIDMGGYLKGTADFEAALDGAIEKDKEILSLLLNSIEPNEMKDELIDKFNELVDIVNEVTVSAKENGWDKSEEFLSEIGVAYKFMDEVNGKLNSKDVIEKTYKNEKVAVINGLIPIFKEYLLVVSEPYVEE